MRAAIARARVNTISTPDSGRAIRSLDDPIAFPLINPSKVITPHHDALVLTLCINNFDEHRVLVDPGSAADLLHLPAFRQMKVPLDKLNSVGIIFFGFNRAITLTMGDIALLVKAGLVTQQVLFFSCRRLGAVQCHRWSSLATRYESSTLDLPSDNQLSDQCWASQPPKQPIRSSPVLSVVGTRA